MHVRDFHVMSCSLIQISLNVRTYLDLNNNKYLISQTSKWKCDTCSQSASLIQNFQVHRIQTIDTCKCARLVDLRKTRIFIEAEHLFTLIRL